MSATRDERLIELFLAARERPDEERPAFVRREAGDDPALAAEVMSLLRHDSPTEDVVGQHARAAATELMTLDPGALDEALDPDSPCAGALPERIGRYRVIRALGRGGFGRVFLAEQDEPRRLVALKVAHAQASPTDLRRFRAEGEALARLQHPGIAQVYDAGVWKECSGRPYLVMEYIEGLALDDYAAAHALSRRRRLELLAQVCDAVAHAHRRGVIHRDLAPKNILVGADGAPRTLDFGVARLMGADGAALTLCRDGVSLVGTLGYMSPEQLSGDPLQVDTRTDVYALGVIAYELLTGRRRLDITGLSLTAALEAARTAPAARPSSVDRSLRGDLDAIVLKATEPDVERRYASASALAADLRRWLRGEPVVARGPNALYLAKKLALRHRTATAAAATLAVGLSAAGAFALRAREAERASHAASLNALDAIVTRVLSPLAPKLGSLDERADLLALIGPDVARIAERAPHHAQAQRLRARFLAAMGDIEDARGSLPIAMTLRAESLAAYKALQAAWPNDLEIAHEHSIAVVRYGNLLVQDGRPDEARRLYEDALALDEAHARARPDDLRFLSNLFWSYRRLSALHEHIDRPRARELAVRGAAVARDMAMTAPGAWRSLEAGTEAQRRLAELSFQDGDSARSLAHAREALASAVRLARLDPMSRHVQTLLVITYRAALDPLMEMGDYEEADRLVADGAMQLRSVMEPGAEPAQRLLMERMLLGLRLAILLHRADYPATLTLQHEAAGLSERLIEALPGDLDQCVWRADTLLARMDTALCLDQPAEIAADVVRLEEHAREMLRLYSDRPWMVAQVELWREMALRRMGGRWLDADRNVAPPVRVAER